MGYLRATLNSNNGCGGSDQRRGKCSLLSHVETKKFRLKDNK